MNCDWCDKIISKKGYDSNDGLCLDCIKEEFGTEIRAELENQKRGSVEDETY